MHLGRKTGSIEKMFVKLERTRASPGSSLVKDIKTVFMIVGPSSVFKDPFCSIVYILACVYVHYDEAQYFALGLLCIHLR